MEDQIDEQSQNELSSLIQQDIADSAEQVDTSVYRFTPGILLMVAIAVFIIGYGIMRYRHRNKSNGR